MGQKEAGAVQEAPGAKPRGKVTRRRGRRGDGSVFRLKRSPNWYIEYAWQGKSYRESSGSPRKKVAEDLLRRKLAAIRAGQPVDIDPHKVMFSELAEDVILDYGIKRNRSLRDVKIRLRLHLEPFFGTIAPVNISNAQAQEYAQQRRADGASDGAIIQELGLLRRILHLGVENRKLTFAPPIKLPKAPPPREGFLEHDQYIRLSDALPEHLRPVLATGYYTGMRLGEIKAIRWDQVDILKGQLRLEREQTKTGEGRVIPLAGELLEMLKIELARRPAGCPFVFTRPPRRHEKADTAWCRVGDFRKVWDAACEAVGLKGLLFHDLRRSAVRTLVRSGVHQHVAMQISGHKTDSIFRRYNIVNERDLREAVAKQDAYVAAEMRREQERAAVAEGQVVPTERLQVN